MKDDKLYVELMLSSSNPHVSFLALSHTIRKEGSIDPETRKEALTKLVDAYEEICRNQHLQQYA
ncbi:hypothetical protein [Alteribacillus iranensis]|uniref:Uncharacterized protein n=1 Tax=Alteribacillus iranensis TaxID=930128 RepID=A0A1I2B1Z4_9BACI|nr:hypothetical protein [Alteribacillus iranensis]SFE50184.1 hypothetical protein SAMN05192532_10239 [Alteribacillus iranensis]